MSSRTQKTAFGLLSAVAASGLGNALAQEEAEPQVFALPEIEVIGVTPLLGTGVDRNKIPGNVQTFSAEDFDRQSPHSIGDFLGETANSVNVNDLQNNPFQPNVNFRGFSVTPLLGSPQQLAVYQNGIRQNEAFGETVNFDLIPEAAVNRLNLMAGSNPVFGLNAMGGAVVAEMKDGFSYQGAEFEASGGYFARRQATLQLGAEAEGIGIYTMFNALEEDGWRNNSPSELRQFFGDISWRGDDLEFGVDVTLADNDLTGNGTSPVELLESNRRAIFTFPDTTINEFAQINLSGEHFLDDATLLQGNAYYRRLIRQTINGDGFDAEPCEDDATILCFDEEDILRDQNGNTIPSDTITSFVGPGALNTSNTQTTTYGGTAQASLSQDLFGRENNFVFGGTLDVSFVTFHSESELGNLTLDRTVDRTGLLVSSDPSDNGVQEISQVRLKTTTRLYGLFFSDTWEALPNLNLTVSGRYNRAEIDLRDEFGDELTSDNTFDRFNPGVGATYQFGRGVTAYASYSESNRAPSAAELGCADETRPCRLPNAFVADPPLDDVVARSVEVGARGRFFVLGDPAPVNWHLGYFRTMSEDDILFINSATFGRGFFDNVGDTLRQGVEASLSGAHGPWSWFVNYSYVDATFQTPFTAPSANNPLAVDGAIQVQEGDTIPGIPEHQLKAGVDVAVTDRWHIGGTLIANSGQFFRGDEANLFDKVNGYQVVNLRSQYAIEDWLEVFVRIDNVFDSEFETFGLFAEVDEVFLFEAPDASDPRAFAPGQPFGAWFGFRIRL